MTQKSGAISTWILIISALFAFLGLAVSASLVFAPASALPNVDLQAKGVTYLSQMWAARQFAVGFIFGYAIYKRSAAMLTLAYLFFLVMNIGDFFIGIGLKDASLYSGAGVMLFDFLWDDIFHKEENKMKELGSRVIRLKRQDAFEFLTILFKKYFLLN